MSAAQKPRPRSIDLLLDVLELNGLDRTHFETTSFAMTLYALIAGWSRTVKQPMTDDEDPSDDKARAGSWPGVRIPGSENNSS